MKGDSDGEELRYWACERTAAAAAALTRYAVDAAGQDGESTRSDWEAVYLELSSAVVATGDDALQKGVEMAVPGPGRTATDSAFAGLDELAGRCEQLGNPIDVVLTGQIGVSRSCEVTGDVTAASIRRGIASGTVVGPFRSSTERTPADGTLEFVSSRLETEASDGIATWVLRPDGGGVFAVDWRAKRSTAFEASETARVFRAFDLSRACAADAGARSS